VRPEWKLARRARFRDAPDFYWVGGTDRPGTVLVRPRWKARTCNPSANGSGHPGDRPADERPHGPRREPRLRDSAGQYLGAAYYGERLEYEFADPALAPHHRALNRFFDNECNVP
jgi:hypothetical protein